MINSYAHRQVQPSADKAQVAVCPAPHVIEHLLLLGIASTAIAREAIDSTAKIFFIIISLFDFY